MTVPRPADVGEPGSAERGFTKHRADAPADFFAWEVAGLTWLGEVSASGGTTVVTVREAGEQHIVLDRIDEVPATARAAEEFGRSLAITHAAGATAFGAGPEGWTGDGFIGRQALLLQPFPRWGEFYAQARLLPFALAARRVGTLDEQGLRVVDRVCARLVDGEYDDDWPPSRIHGDLWGGNVLYAAGGAVLIDPATHGGHPLTDLAMLALFGTEHLDRVMSAHAEAAGLQPGWRDLIGLHQLHPLLVHAVTHGHAYGRQAGLVAQRYR